MPSVILILLIVAAVGVVGSIALIILMSILNIRANRIADEEFEDDYEEDYDEEETEEEDEPAQEPVKENREVVFTPFEQNEVQEEVAIEPVTAPALQLIDPNEVEGGNSAVVGDISLSVGNAQDIGARAQQQDAFAITPLEEQAVVNSRGVMAVVCDGMGGMENGAEAANLGTVTFMRHYLEAKNVDDNTLVDAVFAANAEVYRNHQGKDGSIAGTTLVAASVLPDGLRFVSVGDSHIYLYRKGKVYQLNRDHNYFSELLDQVKAGNLTLEEAQHHPERAHLTSYVGIEKLELVDYNVEPVALRHGDRVLLCSDGLFKTLSIREIAAAMENADAFDAQEVLMEAVKAKGKRKQDNVTIVVMYCDAIA